MGSRRLVDVVESAYSLESDETSWLKTLAQRAAPALDRGLGVIAYVADTATMGMRAFGTTEEAEGVETFIRDVCKDAPPAVFDELSKRPVRFGSISERFFAVPEVRSHWERSGPSYGSRDAVGFFVHGADGRTVNLFAPSPRLERPHPQERRAWERVAVHVSAAYRVRARSAGRSVNDIADAILGCDGYVHYARGRAEADAARDSLRDAVRAMEKARGPLRHRDPERALEMWVGLAAGRWSLLEHWESDGKRYILAIENRPDNLDPRALRPREGAAARLAAEGAAPKDIAYALGISASNARALLASSLNKLGLSSRADLYRWNPADGDVFRVAHHPDIEALVIAEAKPPAFEGLSDAERTVAALAANGESNAAIAQRRQTSVRTVANQMSSVLRKLGLFSRADLLRSPVERDAR
jgi:DNA-binding CsgD family transcriptional regulator